MKRYLLPDLIKKERAFLVKHHSLIVYCLIALSIFCFNYFLTYSTNILGYATNVNVKDLLAQTNSLRINHSLPELRYNEALSRAAAQKAKDMFNQDYWAHVSPSGVEPWVFLLNKKVINTSMQVKI